MARNKKYTVKYKRKREKKTNYAKRMRLLSSNKSRLVVRRMLGNIVVQVIEFNPKGDKTLVSANARELGKAFGWKAHTGNLPSAYLTGLLCALKAKKQGIEMAVLDMGLSRSIKGSAFYAAVKGALEGGLNVPCSESILPGEEKVTGVNIENYAKLLKEDKDKYEKQFSAYIKNGVSVENLSKHVDEVKKAILKKW